MDMDFRLRERGDLQPKAEPMNLELFFSSLAQPEENEIFGLATNLPQACRFNLPGSASAQSPVMAQILGNREYAIALGMLSDYEAMGNLPRHALPR